MLPLMCCLSFCFIPCLKFLHSRFWDIPSPWWQASTILVGVASSLSLLVGVTASAACFVTYVVHTGTARAAGFIQLCAGVFFFVYLESVTKYQTVFKYVHLAWQPS